MFGIGGGAVIVPTLILLFSYGVTQATATSLGVLIWPVTVFAVIAYYRAGQIRIRAALLIASGLIVGGYFGARIALSLPASDENYPGQLNIQAFMAGLDRLPMILAKLVKEIFFLPSWNLTWIGIMGLLYLSGRAALDRAGRLLLIIAVFQLAAYMLAFMITAWTSPAAQMISRSSESVPYLLNLTMGRLLLHFAPLCVVAALRAAPLIRSGPVPVPQDAAGFREGCHS